MTFPIKFDRERERLLTVRPKFSILFEAGRCYTLCMLHVTEK